MRNGINNTKDSFNFGVIGTTFLLFGILYYLTKSLYKEFNECPKYFTNKYKIANITITQVNKDIFASTMTLEEAIKKHNTALKYYINY